MKTIRISPKKLVEFLVDLGIEAELHGSDADIDLIGISTARSPQPNTLWYLSNTNHRPDVAPLSSLLICQAESTNTFSGPSISTINPRLAYGFVTEKLWKPKSKLGIIHQTAVIDDTCKIDPTARIGPFCVIGSNSVIGENTVLENSVTIGRDVSIGNNCLVRSGTVIGEDGFGVETFDKIKTLRLPHLGGVRIGNYVSIGSLNSIAAGTIHPTVIEDYVQTDNLVHIAHNVTVGQSTLITACAEISGSVKIGKQVWLGPNCSIMNGITIGDAALIGLGAVVTKSVLENRVVAGNPAKVLKLRHE